MKRHYIEGITPPAWVLHAGGTDGHAWNGDTTKTNRPGFKQAKDVYFGNMSLNYIITRYPGVTRR